MPKTLGIGLCVLVIGILFWWAVARERETSGEIAKISEIKPDEQLLFFRSSGWFDEAVQRWRIPIHGWIYEPQDSRVRKAAFEKLLKEKYGLVASSATRENFDQRINWLLADNERNKRIVIRIGETVHELPASAEDGHIESTLEIAPFELPPVEKGVLRYAAVTAPGERRVFEGEVRLLAPKGKSIISDIDDTVKRSYVTDRTKLLEQTLFNDFDPVQGMPELYRTWSQRGGNVHFVSSSPWQLYRPLEVFLATHDFPWATLSLKKVRFRDSSLLTLFKKGTETKPLAIESILNAYPARVFTLIGDSGEQDAEVYADIARRYRHQIEKIYIRWIGEAPVDIDRFEAIFDGLATNKWQVFRSPAEIEL